MVFGVNADLNKTPGRLKHQTQCGCETLEMGLGNLMNTESMKASLPIYLPDNHCSIE